MSSFTTAQAPSLSLFLAALALTTVGGCGGTDTRHRVSAMHDVTHMQATGAGGPAPGATATASVPKLQLLANSSILELHGGAVLVVEFLLFDDEGDPADVEALGRVVGCGAVDPGVNIPATLTAASESNTGMTTSATGSSHTLAIELSSLGHVPGNTAVVHLELGATDAHGAGATVALVLPVPGEAGGTLGMFVTGPLQSDCRRVRSAVTIQSRVDDLTRIDFHVRFDPTQVAPNAIPAMPHDPSSSVFLTLAELVAPDTLHVVVGSGGTIPDGPFVDVLWDFLSIADPGVLPAGLALGPAGEASVAIGGVEEPTEHCLQTLASVVQGGDLAVGEFEMRGTQGVPPQTSFSTEVVANFGRRPVGAYLVDIFYDPALLSALRVDPPPDRLIVNVANIRTGADAGHLSVVGVNPTDIPEASCVRPAFTIHWHSANVPDDEVDIRATVSELVDIDTNPIGAPVPYPFRDDPFRIFIRR